MVWVGVVFRVLWCCEQHLVAVLLCWVQQLTVGQCGPSEPSGGLYQVVSQGAGVPWSNSNLMCQDVQ